MVNATWRTWPLRMWGTPTLGPLWAATTSAFPTVLLEVAKFPTVEIFRVRCCLRRGLSCVDFRVTEQWLLNVQLRSWHRILNGVSRKGDGGLKLREREHHPELRLRKEPLELRE